MSVSQFSCWCKLFFRLWLIRLMRSWCIITDCTTRQFVWRRRCEEQALLKTLTIMQSLENISICSCLKYSIDRVQRLMKKRKNQAVIITWRWSGTSADTNVMWLRNWSQYNILLYRIFFLCYGFINFLYMLHYKNVELYHILWTLYNLLQEYYGTFLLIEQFWVKDSNR